jgi:DNA-binding MarR family transcriptional regulator
VDDVGSLLNSLCHLMVSFERAVVGDPDGSGEVLGLDMPGLAVLVSLDLFGEMRPSSVAELLGGTTSMATKVVGRVERHGYVVRRHGEVAGDRRAVTVQLTEAGRAAIDRCEAVLSGLSLDLQAAMLSVDRATAPEPGRRPDPVDLPGEHPPSTGPPLAEFLRFVVAIDKPILATAGHLKALHPADPRGLLVLSELELRGGLRVGDVAALVDRSRNTVERLVRDLEADSLVRRGPGGVAGDGRAVVVELTGAGSAIIRGIVAAIRADLPELRPVMTALGRALSGERQGLGAARP